MLSQPLENNISALKRETKKAKKKKSKKQEALAEGIDDSIQEVVDFTDESVSIYSLASIPEDILEAKWM